MSKIISLFNHKGGVSKTTTTFHLGWALAEKGIRTLMVDADPQCNLTGYVLGLNDSDEFEDFYTNNSSIYSSLSPVFQGTQTPLEPAQILPTKQENLFLLPGHVSLSESETQLAVALSAGSAIPALRNLPGSISNLLKITSEFHKLDIVLIDMSPSIGALNQCLLMGSDYFIVPTVPDYYCDQAIQSLSKVLPRWNEEVSAFRQTSLAYPLSITPPVFLGTISQRYRPRNGAPAASFQKWIDQIKSTVRTCLVPVLEPLGMCVDEKTFISSVINGDTPFNIANITDFNSLIALSQDHNVPVYVLSEEQIAKTGSVLYTMVKSRNNFREIFDNISKSVIKLIG